MDTGRIRTRAADVSGQRVAGTLEAISGAHEGRYSQSGNFPRHQAPAKFQNAMDRRRTLSPSTTLAARAMGRNLEGHPETPAILDWAYGLDNETEARSINQTIAISNHSNASRDATEKRPNARTVGGKAGSTLRTDRKMGKRRTDATAAHIFRLGAGHGLSLGTEYRNAGMIPQ